MISRSKAFYPFFILIIMIIQYDNIGNIIILIIIIKYSTHNINSIMRKRPFFSNWCVYGIQSDGELSQSRRRLIFSCYGPRFYSWEASLKMPAS